METAAERGAIVMAVSMGYPPGDFRSIAKSRGAIDRVFPQSNKSTIRTLTELLPHRFKR